MYIRILSDLHLEFIDYQYEIPKLITDKETVLILAGDIGIDPLCILNWISEFNNRFLKVLYVLGNHEFYNYEYNSLIIKFKNSINNRKLDNVVLLHDDNIIIDNINFIGSTLWTNFDNNNPITTQYCSYRVNDFRMIYYNYSFITPKHLITIHNKSLKFLKDTLSNSKRKRNIVITHHSPSFNFLDSEYAGDSLNGSFASNLDYMFEDYKINYWIFGHTHNNVNTKANKTKVITNQRGYSHDLSPGFDDKLVIKVK
jgi:predicted phosphodiesterase